MAEIIKDIIRPFEEKPLWIIKIILTIILLTIAKGSLKDVSAIDYIEIGVFFLIYCAILLMINHLPIFLEGRVKK